MATPTGSRHRVVIVGAGFGGLFAAKRLRRSNVSITLIDRFSHHLFQPLLYQVATGILSAGEIAPAVREVLKRQRNTRVLRGEVSAIDLARRTVTSVSALGETVLGYDSLIVAVGSRTSYFGHEEYAEAAPGLKTLDDAMRLRSRIFDAFELAEVASDPEVQRRLLTFVVIGAGPTGVELAGQIAELAHRALRNEYRNVDPTKARVVLVDAAPAVLGGIGGDLSRKAETRLEHIRVTVRLGTKVLAVDAEGVEVATPSGAVERIDSSCMVWAAGVSAAPLAAQLAAQCGADVDRLGRIEVGLDLTLPGHPEVFVVGDMAATGLPGVAQVAMQGGKFAARVIADRTAGRARTRTFKYHDRGTLATISRFSAVARIGRLEVSGFLGWVLWLVVHLTYLIGFKNRVTTLLHWTVSFIGRGRSNRTSPLAEASATGDST